MKIGVTALKGGVGKSTVSFHLAAALAKAYDVLLVDADPQASIMAANSLRERPHIYKVQQAPRVHVETFLKGLDYPMIVIDSPPRTDAIARAVIAASDLVIIPITPGPFEVLAFDDLQPLLADKDKVRILLNRTNQTAISKSMRDTIGGLGIQVFETELPMLVDYQDSITQGLGVTEFKTGSVAAQRIRSLMQEILKNG